MSLSDARKFALVIKDKLPQLEKSFAQLTKNDVLVGVPSNEALRKPEPGEEAGPMNNATIAYIQDNGSPAANIPARPFMLPGIEACRGRIINTFKSSAKQVLNGAAGAADIGLHRAGLIAQASIRATINEGIPPPLADATLRQRARKGSKGAKMELELRAKGGAPSTAFAKPLVSSAQLRNSINYVIRPKK